MHCNIVKFCMQINRINKTIDFKIYIFLSVEYILPSDKKD